MTEKEIHLYTLYSKEKEACIDELNSFLKEGWIIDTINCDNCNDYEVEADLIIYLIKRS